MSEFTAEEKSRIQHFLGYPDWESLAASVHLGVPAVSQVAFMVHDSFKRMSAAAMATIRKDLCECEAIESEISQARGRLRAKKLGSLEVNSNEIAALRSEQERWNAQLANDLGVPLNKYAIPSLGRMNAAVVGGEGTGGF